MDSTLLRPPMTIAESLAAIDRIRQDCAGRLSAWHDNPKAYLKEYGEVMATRYRLIGTSLAPDVTIRTEDPNIRSTIGGGLVLWIGPCSVYDRQCLSLRTEDLGLAKQRADIILSTLGMVLE